MCSKTVWIIIKVPVRPAGSMRQKTNAVDGQRNGIMRDGGRDGGTEG
jgi:hypothetical protein